MLDRLHMDYTKIDCIKFKTNLAVNKIKNIKNNRQNSVNFFWIFDMLFQIFLILFVVLSNLVINVIKAYDCDSLELLYPNSFCFFSKVMILKKH